MGTDGQNMATAAARAARARKAAAGEDAIGALQLLLDAVTLPRLDHTYGRGESKFPNLSCLACHEKNRHLSGHRCNCACHRAREILDALR